MKLSRVVGVRLALAAALSAKSLINYVMVLQPIEGKGRTPP
jgi:hypothetical protein